MLTSLRIVAGAVALTLRFPRVLLFGYLLVTIPAVLIVWPVWAAMHEALAHHPGAVAADGWRLDLALDGDFARQHPGLAVSVAGGGLFALVAFAFLAGGVLMSVRSGRPFSFTEFLANGGRMLFRNLRVLLFTCVAGLLIGLAQSAFDHYVVHDLLADTPTGPLALSSGFLSVEFGLECIQWLFGLAFVWVVLISKLAMARLAIYQTSSAFNAWFAALGKTLRRPLRTGFLAVWIVLLWLAGTHVVGEVLVRQLESSGRTDGSLWVPFAIGQVGILWTQVIVIGSWIAARRLLADNRKGGAGEPIVQVRSARPS